MVPIVFLFYSASAVQIVSNSLLAIQLSEFLSLERGKTIMRVTTVFLQMLILRLYTEDCRRIFECLLKWRLKTDGGSFY
jgi:hypothetical protein